MAILWGVFVLFIVVFIVLTLFATGRMKKVVFWRPKFTYIGLGIYIAFGFVAMLSIQGRDVLPRVSDADLQQALAADSEMRDALFNAAYSELNSKYLQQQWTFPVAGDTVVIKYSNQNSGKVYVNYSSEQGNEITLSYFATPNINYSTDVSAYIKPPNVSFINNTLYVYYDENQELKYRQMKPTLSLIEHPLFPMYQIDSAGTYALYLNVPQNVHIINEGGYWTPIL